MNRFDLIDELEGFVAVLLNLVVKMKKKKRKKE